MKKIQYALILFYILIIPFLTTLFCYAYADDKSLENQLKRNITKVQDLSDITVSGFKWKNKSKDTLGVFSFIEINNSSKLAFKNIKLDVYIYDKDGVGYKFLLPIKGQIPPKTKKKFTLVRTPILQLAPETTDLIVKSAQLDYEKDTLKIKVKNAIDINEFDYIIDNVAAKIIQVDKLSYTNQSENSFKEIVFSVNFFDEKGDLIKYVNFKNKGVIGPGETRVDENFQIPGVDLGYFSKITLTVSKGKLISDREYSFSQKSNVESTGSYSPYDTPLPQRDLQINNFNITNKVRNTIGLLDVSLSNNSRYEYKDIVFSVQFIGSSGNTITSKKMKIKDIVKPYSTNTFKDKEFGLLDNDFNDFRLSVLSAKAIGSIDSIKPKSSSVNKKVLKKEVLELIKFDSNNELIILDSNIDSLSSIKVLNVSDINIYNPIFELILFGKDNEIVKSIILRSSGVINPRKERTFRSIEIDTYDTYVYKDYRIKFISAEKLK